MVDYDELPAVDRPGARDAPGAPVLCDGGARQRRRRDAPRRRRGHRRRLRSARRTACALDLVNQRLAPARWSRAACWPTSTGERPPDVRLSSQMPTGVRDGLAAALPGLTQQNVRVLVGDVGGGFGMKTGIYPEDIAVALGGAAR